MDRIPKPDDDNPFAGLINTCIECDAKHGVQIISYRAGPGKIIDDLDQVIEIILTK